jgi:hypothetical protein
MKKYLLLFSTVLILVSCASEKKFVKNPVDIMIRDMNTVPEFSIILYDMEVEGNYSKVYRHQYQVISELSDELKTETTEWQEVPKDFFAFHENNMGMEIASKDSTGKVSKSVSPAGYSNYIGNEKYGQWRQRDGGSFWEFYGKYAMLSSVFHMMTYPARYSHWNDYRSNYRGYGRSYYGPNVNGRSTYGTYSNYNSKTRSNSSYTNSSSFKNRVNSKVQRSGSSAGKSSANQKRTRSSNRYTSSSRSRSSSRGGK